MCDIALWSSPGKSPLWFAKNSDREAGEVQALEFHSGAGLVAGAPAELRALSPQRSACGALICRPTWMWGCEMGVNDHGVVLGNTAVFTKQSVPRVGLSGMDFQRHVLAYSRSAEEALSLLIDLVERVEQGGRMGFRQTSFRYHSAFMVGAADGGWLLETAGRHWAARHIDGAATLSNALTIGQDFDRIGEATRALVSAGRSDFARRFARRSYDVLSGADERRACTADGLAKQEAPTLENLIALLSDHNQRSPAAGLRSTSPCAHASWLPTRTAAQTTASLICRVDASGVQAWSTGTSAPCLSVFKPAPLSEALFASDGSQKTLWYQHERLHRFCMQDYEPRAAALSKSRAAFQAECLAASDAAQAWEAHRAIIPEWLRRAAAAAPHAGPSIDASFWRRAAARDGISIAID